MHLVAASGRDPPSTWLDCPRPGGRSPMASAAADLALLPCCAAGALPDHGPSTRLSCPAGVALRWHCDRRPWSWLCCPAARRAPSQIGHQLGSAALRAASAAFSATSPPSFFSLPVFRSLFPLSLRTTLSHPISPIVLSRQDRSPSCRSPATPVSPGLGWALGRGAGSAGARLGGWARRCPGPRPRDPFTGLGGCSTSSGL